MRCTACIIRLYIRHIAIDEHLLRILFDHHRYVMYLTFKFHGANIVIDFERVNIFYHFYKFIFDRRNFCLFYQLKILTLIVEKMQVHIYVIQ